MAIKKYDVEGLIREVEKHTELTDNEKNAMRRAFCTRGRNKGQLKAQAPNSYDDPLGNTAWNGMQPNAFKIQMCNMIFTSGNEECNVLRTKLVKLVFPTWLDRDKEALVNMGAW